VRARYETVLVSASAARSWSVWWTRGIRQKRAGAGTAGCGRHGLQASAANAQYLLAEEELKRYRELRDKGCQPVGAGCQGNRAESGRGAGRFGAQSGAYTSLLSDRDGVVSATLAEVGQW